MKIVTSEQMRSIDRRAIERYSIPSIVLMENAAIAVVSVIETKFPNADVVSIVCGKGNNGGDGLAIARHLHNRHRSVDVLLAVDSIDAIGGDVRVMYDAAKSSGVVIHTGSDDDAIDRWLARATTADLVVDALLGTGLSRPAEGAALSIIEGFRELRMPVVAVDVPSGLDATHPDRDWPVVDADVTVTFALPKISTVFAPSNAHCGEVIVADISLPHAAIDEERLDLSLMTAGDTDVIIPRREVASHKGTHGHVGLVCGSEGRSGAAILAARGALRGGAGLVTVLTDAGTAQIVDAQSIESMSKAIDLDDLRPPDLERFDVVAIGSGLPDEERTYEFLRNLIAAIEKPMVLDAGAISAHRGAPERLAGGAPKVLTPHPGELARLLGIETKEIQADRIRYVREAAKRTKAIVILKGHQTLVADPDGEVSVNPTGHPAMATGGMGDVLTGLVAAFIGGGIGRWDAARAGVFLHGLAGEIAAKEIGESGVLAGEVADRIPAALTKVRG